MILLVIFVRHIVYENLRIVRIQAVKTAVNHCFAMFCSLFVICVFLFVGNAGYSFTCHIEINSSEYSVDCGTSDVGRSVVETFRNDRKDFLHL